QPPSPSKSSTPSPSSRTSPTPTPPPKSKPNKPSNDSAPHYWPAHRAPTQHSSCIAATESPCTKSPKNSASPTPWPNAISPKPSATASSTCKRVRKLHEHPTTLGTAHHRRSQHLVRRAQRKHRRRRHTQTLRHLAAPLTRARARVLGDHRILGERGTL